MIVALVLVNGVLAGSEIAVVSLRKTRLRELVDEGRGAARAVLRLRDQPERFLATVQIGITVISATAGAFGGASFAEDLAPLFRGLPGVGQYAEQLALVLVVSLISYLSLVLGELVPKSLALRSSERYALWIGRPLWTLSVLARPLVWALTASSNAVLRVFGDRTNFIEARISPEELQQLVSEASGAGGTLDPAAAEIAHRALELGDLTAADVMVPRSQVVALPVDATPGKVREVLSESMHTRLPVYRGTLDRVVGYVSVKDLLFFAWDQQLFVLQDLLRKPYFVPETQKALKLLEEMRARRVPFAMAVDEQGGLAGIVTIEDLLEELVGEIFSEHDRGADEGIHREPDGAALVSALVPVREVNRRLGLELPEDGDWTTLGGLCLALAGRIPVAGETLTAPGGVMLEVVEASPRQVRAVRVRPPPPPRSPSVQLG